MSDAFNLFLSLRQVGGNYLDLNFVLPAALLALGAALSWLVLRWRARRRRLVQRRAAERGRLAELSAPKALASLGYKAVERHPRLTYEWRIDGRKRQTNLEADLLVQRGRRRYLVEVKTGKGADPSHAATRRQLLEYQTFYPVDGLFLLDGDRGRLMRIDFPRPVDGPPRHARLAAAAFAGAVTGAALAWLGFSMIR